jgi:hypothetical protein
MIYDLPDHRFRGDELSLVHVQQVNRSAYTRRRKVMSNPWHSYWRLSNAEHAPIVGEENIRPWRAFFAKLDGIRNHFRYPAVDTDQHTGSVTATVLSSTNTVTFAMSGMPASVTFLPAGSRLTVRLVGGQEQLIELKVALITNGSGQATPSFWPPLRGAPIIGSTVETKRPWAVLALEEPQQSISSALGRVYSFTINAVEEFSA